MQCGTLNGTKTNGAESIYEDLSWNGSMLMMHQFFAGKALELY